MLDPIPQKRRSLRHTLWLLSAVAATAVTSGVQAEPPGSGRVPLTPKRLPRVAAARPVDSSSARQAVQPCSAELDALVESWFAEPDAEQAGEPAVSDLPPAKWLRSTSSAAAAETARRVLARATRELEVGAWLSAETSAWEAIKWSAESIDLAARERGELQQTTSLHHLQQARDAIREARDFSGVYGPIDGEAIRRMAISHQTDLLDQESMVGLTATDASDRYLDHARVLLAPLAQDSVEAAQGLDLLAAVYLKRADAKTLPSATALCLRRAALQGQPRNASLASRLGMHLADLGLLDEARWALEHSLAMQLDPATAQTLVQVLQRSGHQQEAAEWTARLKDQLHGGSRLSMTTQDPYMATASDGSPIRVPDIVEVSPQEFAAISQPVIPFEKSNREPEATTAQAPLNHETKATTVAEQVSFRSPAAEAAETEEQEKPSLLRRLFGSWKRIW